MNATVLLAETPRAGGLGHRFLVPTGCSISEANLTAFFQSAGENPIGCNFLAVSRAVEQHVDGGAVREGAEVLILAGIDVSKMSDSERRYAKVNLHALMDSLAKLVTSDIEWSLATEPGLIVTRPEFAEWLRDTPAFRVPSTEWRRGPQRSALAGPPPRNWQSRLDNNVKNIAVVAISLVIGAFGGIAVDRYLTTPRNPKVAHPGSSSVKPSTLTKSVAGGADVPHTDIEGGSQVRRVPNEPEMRLSKLAAEWGCDSEELARSLLRTKNWERRVESNSLTTGEALNDGGVLELLNKIEASEGLERFFVTSVMAGEDGFSRFVQLQSLQTPADSTKLRQWLYSVWQKYDDLKTKANHAKSVLSSPCVKNEDKFAKILVLISEGREEEGLGVDFQKPSTPLFDRQDVMIFRLLDYFRQNCQDKVFEQESESADGETEDDLAGFVQKLRERETLITNSLEMERALLNDRIHQIAEKAQSKSVGTDGVFKAYSALDKFLIELGKH